MGLRGTHGRAGGVDRAKGRGKKLAAIELFLVRCGGDSHLSPFSHFLKCSALAPRLCPFIFSALREHIRNGMNVAF